MAEGKKTVMVYTDWIHTFDALSDEDAGKLIKHLLAYVNDKNPEELPGLLKAVWAPIQATLKRDLKAWEGVCEKNRQNVLKRWNKKNTTVYDRIPPDTKHTDKDKDKDKEVIIGKKNKFLEEARNVTLKDLQEYVAQSTYAGADPKWLFNKLQSFIDNGWVDGLGKPIKSSWKGKLRNQLPHAPEIKKDSPYNTPKLR